MGTDNPNDRQVGGEHYKAEYQHWDFVCDTNMHYLLGCATKYVSRWRKKNGRQDLEKAIHYLEKAMERDIKMNAAHEKATWARIYRFCQQLDPTDADIIQRIVTGHYATAIGVIDFLLKDAS